MSSECMFGCVGMVWNGVLGRGTGRKGHAHPLRPCVYILYASPSPAQPCKVRIGSLYSVEVLLKIVVEISQLVVDMGAMVWYIG